MLNRRDACATDIPQAVRVALSQVADKARRSWAVTFTVEFNVTLQVVDEDGGSSRGTDQSTSSVLNICGMASSRPCRKLPSTSKTEPFLAELIVASTNFRTGSGAFTMRSATSTAMLDRTRSTKCSICDVLAPTSRIADRYRSKWLACKPSSVMSLSSPSTMSLSRRAADGRVGGVQGRVTDVNSCWRRLTRLMKSHTANTCQDMKQRRSSVERTRPNMECVFSSVDRCSRSASELSSTNFIFTTLYGKKPHTIA